MHGAQVGAYAYAVAYAPHRTIYYNNALNCLVTFGSIFYHVEPHDLKMIGGSPRKGDLHFDSLPRVWVSTLLSGSPLLWHADMDIILLWVSPKLRLPYLVCLLSSVSIFNWVNIIECLILVMKNAQCTFLTLFIVMFRVLSKSLVTMAIILLSHLLMIVFTKLGYVSWRVERCDPLLNDLSRNQSSIWSSYHFLV